MHLIIFFPQTFTAPDCIFSNLTSQRLGEHAVRRQFTFVIVTDHAISTILSQLLLPQSAAAEG